MAHNSNVVLVITCGNDVLIKAPTKSFIGGALCGHSLSVTLTTNGGAASVAIWMVFESISITDD